MKIDKTDEPKLKNIFEVLKNSQMKIEGHITRNDVIGFIVSEHKQEEKKVAKNEFRRLSKILIDLNLARLKIGNWVNEDELYIIPETLTTNIEDVFKSEREKEHNNDIIARLNEKNLSHIEFILKWKWAPFWGIAISVIALIVSIRSCNLQEKQINLQQKVESQEMLIDTSKINTKKPL